MVVIEELSPPCNGHEAQLADLQRKQELLARKHEDAEVLRQGQLQIVSERVYELERRLTMAEREKHNVIDKANAAFQKQHTDVQHDRQNLAASIKQVNDNFDLIWKQLAETQESLSHSQPLQVNENFDRIWKQFAETQESLSHRHRDIGSLTNEAQQQRTDVAILQQSLQSARLCLDEQGHQILELGALLQAMHATLPSLAQASHLDATMASEGARRRPSADPVGVPLRRELPVEVPQPQLRGQTTSQMRGLPKGAPDSWYAPPAAHPEQLLEAGATAWPTASSSGRRARLGEEVLEAPIGYTGHAALVETFPPDGTADVYHLSGGAPERGVSVSSVPRPPPSTAKPSSDARRWYGE